jgi:hypothetical protein
VSFSIDTRDFEKAIRKVIDASGKDAADILNKAGRTLILGGRGFGGLIKLFPRADKEKIRAIPQAVLASIVAKKFGRGTLSRAEFGREMRKVRARRMSAVGYHAGPGWHEAARAFGGRGVRTQSGYKRSMAARGRGARALARRLVAEVVNTAPAAAKIGQDAMRKALSNTTRDLISYANRKLEQRFKRV